VKLCSRCKETKSTQEFIRAGKYFHSYCNPCRHEYDNRRYHSNPKRYYNPEYILEWKRKNYYGISRYQLNEMLLDQEDKCAICQIELDWRKMHVDHNHKTGKVRGLLCYKCNVALGHFNDSPAIVRAAADYMTRSEFK